MKPPRLLVYGASGHTGGLVARRAKESGLDVIVAGRNPARLQPLAASLGCEWRAAQADTAGNIQAILGDVAVLINAAGPFSDTASLVAKACIDAQTHYLDVSGDVDAYGYVRERSGAARKANVLLMPGAGYCVVASSFLLRELTSPARVPPIDQPTSVRIAFTIGPASSVGSIKSVFASLGTGVVVVRDRDLEAEPVGLNERAIDFQQFGGRLACTAISAADTDAALRDAPLTVRQIETYVEGSLLERTLVDASGRLTRVTKVQPAKAWVDFAMRRWPATPDSGVDTRSVLAVEVEDAWLKTYTAVRETSDTYAFTAVAACEIAKLVLAGVNLQYGFHTPASLYFGNKALDPLFA